MKDDISRTIIEIIVRKAIKEIEDSPKRVTRNLVDMALEFSKGRFQQRFFRAVQTMLKNENSAYYSLIYDAVSHTDTDRLMSFGINLGYHSCTLGAKKIREIEETQGFNVPWSVVLHIDSRMDQTKQEQYHSAIRQGEEMGIFTWQIFADGELAQLLSFLSAHRDSAFILFCEPESITTSFLEFAKEQKHLMLVLHYNEHISDVCERLRKEGFLYSIYRSYAEDDLEEIFNGDWLCCTEMLHPAFTALAALPDCMPKNKKAVHSYIKKTREFQTYQTIPWETTYDYLLIDSIISNEPCSAAFDSDGFLHTLTEQKTETEYNLFYHDLKDIFQKAFPKQNR